MDVGCALQETWAEVRDATIAILDNTTFATLVERSGGRWVAIRPEPLPASARRRRRRLMGLRERNGHRASSTTPIRAGRESGEIEFGRDWSDGAGGRCEVLVGRRHRRAVRDAGADRARVLRRSRRRRGPARAATEDVTGRDPRGRPVARGDRRDASTAGQAGDAAARTASPGSRDRVANPPAPCRRRTRRPRHVVGIEVPGATPPGLRRPGPEAAGSPDRAERTPSTCLFPAEIPETSRHG